MKRLRAYWPHLPHFQVRTLFQYAFLLLLGGVLLFIGLPYMATFWDTPLNYAEPAIWSGILIFHAIVDGLIWKPRTASALRPAT